MRAQKQLMSHAADCSRLIVRHAIKILSLRRLRTSRISCCMSPSHGVRRTVQLRGRKCAAPCTDFDPAICLIFSQLVRSFRRSQPVTARRIPQCDFTLVLSVLCRRECRDALLPLPILGAKTVFVLALSSGERRHALAALAFPPSFAASSVTLPFNEDHIPKSYFLRRNLSRIGPLFIPMCSNPKLQQVCRVRTLRFYLDAVASHRASSQTSLIIPHDLTSVTNVSVLSVGRYIVRLVRFCYPVDWQLIHSVTVMMSAKLRHLCARLPQSP